MSKVTVIYRLKNESNVHVFGPIDSSKEMDSGFYKSIVATRIGKDPKDFEIIEIRTVDDNSSTVAAAFD